MRILSEQTNMKSESKRYYWLKLEKTFFGDVKIKMIRNTENGDTYTTIYLKILLETIDKDGILKLEGLFEDEPMREIALTIDESFENVAVAMELFKKLGLCQYEKDNNNNNVFYFKQAQDCTGSITDRGIRKRNAIKNAKEGNNKVDNRSNTNVCDDIYDITHGICDIHNIMEENTNINANTDITSNTNTDTNTITNEELNSTNGGTSSIEKEIDIEQELKQDVDTAAASASNKNTSDKNKSRLGEYYKLIVNIYNNFGYNIKTINESPAFRSDENQSILASNIINSKYNILQCIDHAHKKTKEYIASGKTTKPLFEFRDLFYVALLSGGQGIEREYSDEQKAQMRKQEEARAEQIRSEQAEAEREILELTDEYTKQTAILFNVSEDKIEEYSLNYEGGLVAFFMERERRAALANMTLKKS